MGTRSEWRAGQAGSQRAEVPSVVSCGGLLSSLTMPSRHAAPPTPPGDLLKKFLSVTKPGGHYAHIFNPSSDNPVLEAAREAHAQGKGPAVGTTLVKPHGEQLQQVGAAGACLPARCSGPTLR